MHRKRDMPICSRWLSIGLFVVSSISGAVSTAEENPSARVEGDLNLLKTAISAQKVNAAAFPNGRLRFDVLACALRNPEPVEEQFIGSIAWEGTSTRWHYDMTDRSRQTGKIVRRSLNIDQVAGQTRIVTYFGDTGGLFDSDRKRTSISRLLHQRPEECWHRVPVGMRTWAEYLSPEFAPHTLDHMSVEPGSDETIVIRRFLKQEGVSTVTVSMRHGGNVVRYEMTPLTPRKGYASRGKQAVYGWVLTPVGHYRLAKLDYSEFDQVVTNPAYTRTVHIMDFESPTHIASGEFTLKSLKVD